MGLSVLDALGSCEGESGFIWSGMLGSSGEGGGGVTHCMVGKYTVDVSSWEETVV